MLPDVVEDRRPVLLRQLSHTIDQRIVGAAAGGELDPDHAGGNPEPDLPFGVRSEVRVDGDIAANAIGMLALEGAQCVVRVSEIGR